MGTTSEYYIIHRNDLRHNRDLFIVTEEVGGLILWLQQTSARHLGKNMVMNTTEYTKLVDSLHQMTLVNKDMGIPLEELSKKNSDLTDQLVKQAEQYTNQRKTIAELRKKLAGKKK
jgi:hypothetical protein